MTFLPLNKDGLCKGMKGESTSLIKVVQSRTFSMQKELIKPQAKPHGDSYLRDKEYVIMPPVTI